MLTLEVFVALIAFALVSSITPGPNNLLVMASGTNFGFTRTVPHMLGISAGLSIMLLLVGFGLSKVFDAFPVSYVALKIVSATYLLYLAWKIANAAPMAEEGQPGIGKPFGFRQAAMFQAANPKAWTMAISAVAAYVPVQAPLLGILTVTLTFALVCLPCISAWALMGSQLRSVLSDPRARKVFNVTAAALLVASLYPIVFGAAH